MVSTPVQPNTEHDSRRLAFVAQKPEVSILVVAFRSREFILDCIESIFDETRRTPFEVLLIDNSDDGTGELVAERFPLVRVIPNRKNLGFGRGNNKLAAHAFSNRILLLNPDTKVTNGAIDRLVDFAKANTDAGAWAGVTVTPEGVQDAGNRMVIPSFRTLLRWAFGDAKALEAGGLGAGATSPGRVDVLPGGYMMVRHDVWMQLSGFDESFFLYSEEIDFFLRFRRAGHTALVTPDSVVIHDAGSGERISPQRLLYRTKGQMHFVRKHWPAPLAQIALALLWFGFSWRWLASVVLSPAGRRASSWRAKRRAYGGLVLRPWRWWKGYAP